MYPLLAGGLKKTTLLQHVRFSHRSRRREQAKALRRDRANDICPEANGPYQNGGGAWSVVLGLPWSRR